MLPSLGNFPPSSFLGIFYTLGIQVGLKVPYVFHRGSTLIALLRSNGLVLGPVCGVCPPGNIYSISDNSQIVNGVNS